MKHDEPKNVTRSPSLAQAPAGVRGLDELTGGGLPQGRLTLLCGSAGCDKTLTVTKLMDDAGNPVGLASTERDITVRKRAVEEARRMVMVVRDSNDAITIQDLEGQITAWNRGAELMFGYSEQEALQMTSWQLAHLWR